MADISILVDTPHFTSEIWKYLLRVGVLFDKPYRTRAQPEWRMVPNNTATQERYFHISRVLSGVYRLHNDPEFRNKTYSVPV